MKFFIILMFSSFSVAHAHSEMSVTDIIQSGRDGDVFQINQSAIEKINAALDYLGISRPPHRLEFVPSGELPHLATLGRPAVGHWYDGSLIVTHAKEAMGVLEFVTPGCPTCRSFYSDSTPPEHQIEIFKHVAGHNDFSVNSSFCTIRQPCDMIATAQQLYEWMENAYKLYEFDEVAQWYQYLSSLTHAQDLVRGTFRAPENFIRNSNQSFEIHPKNPTPHELQLLVNNLPDELPLWKKEMAVLFEKMNRMFGYIISTKIMNEGWATFLQDFLVPYLSWKGDFDLIESATLKSGVSFPRLSNPYWLGREAWRNLYQRFMSESHVKNLSSQLEKDQKFVHYAHQIMREMGDYDFLKLALDQAWVAKNHLFLYRKAKKEEIDSNLPPSDKPNQEQKIVVSTSAQDVSTFIAKRYADRSLQFPSVLVENISATGRNVFSLVHEMIENIPLRKDSIAPALFVRTQIWHRSVSLKTMACNLWTNQSSKRIKFYPIRIEVEPSGKVAVFKIEDPSKEVLDPVLTSDFEKSLNAFQDQIQIGQNDEQEEKKIKRFLPFVTQVADLATHSSVGIVSHNMSSASALLRYYEIIERRVLGSIKKSINQLHSLKKTKTGVKIKVLPDIPELSLDLSVRRLIDQEKLKSIEFNVDSSNIPSTISGLISENAENLRPLNYNTQIDIGSSPYQPKNRDRFWGDSDSSGSQGSQDSGEESDSEEGEERDPEPTEIEVPLEVLSEFLTEEVRLPFLRPKPGSSTLLDTERDGARIRSYGDILWNRLLPKALVKGKISLQKQGLDPELVDRKRWLSEGMKLIHPSDWLVSGVEKVLKPEMNAVIVFWMDMTGSMMGDPIEMAKKFIFNLKLLLSAKYKNLTFRYVGFSNEAVEFPNENQFFKTFIGGGTKYSAGIRKTQEILNEYDSYQWDKYTFGIGDAEDSEPDQSIPQLIELKNSTQFSAFIYTDASEEEAPTQEFLDQVKVLADEDIHFGFVRLTPQLASPIQALRDLLGPRSIQTL